MNSIKTFLLLAPAFLLLVSCQNHGLDKLSLFSKEKVIIHLQPLGNFPESHTNTIYAALKKIYPFVEINSPIPLPNTALNKKKTRYRADVLIKLLNETTQRGHVTIGLTTKDISTTKNNVQDWGVMGLGYKPGRSCVASSFRLNKQQQLEQLFKVAIHELGHTQGLPHCAEKTCFMRNAEGKNPTNEETAFCPKCKKVMVNAGWNLK